MAGTEYPVCIIRVDGTLQIGFIGLADRDDYEVVAAIDTNQSDYSLTIYSREGGYDRTVIIKDNAVDLIDLLQEHLVGAFNRHTVAVVCQQLRLWRRVAVVERYQRRKRRFPLDVVYVDDSNTLELGYSWDLQQQGLKVKTIATMFSSGMDARKRYIGEVYADALYFDRDDYKTYEFEEPDAPSVLLRVAVELTRIYGVNAEQAAKELLSWRDDILDSARTER